MEKLKDLLHDFTDVVLALGIVVAMFAVVALNLGDWFDYGEAIALADTAINMAVTDEGKEDVKEEPLVEEEPKETTEDTTEEDTKENTEDQNTNTEKNNEEPVKENPPAEEKQPKKTTEEKEKPIVTVVEVKQITIPDGTPGVNIAKILQKNGLITDSAEFIKVAEDLKLAVKLKSGTFDIPTNATVEEMVKIIARAK